MFNAKRKPSVLGILGAFFLCFYGTLTEASCCCYRLSNHLLMRWQTTPAATAPLEWGEEAFSATMYVNQSCYSRIKALMGSEAVKQYTYGEAVNVVAKTDTGYYKLNDGEYIHGDYLSEAEL